MIFIERLFLLIYSFRPCERRNEQCLHETASSRAIVRMVRVAWGLPQVDNILNTRKTNSIRIRRSNQQRIRELKNKSLRCAVILEIFFTFVLWVIQKWLLLVERWESNAKLLEWECRLWIPCMYCRAIDHLFYFLHHHDHSSFLFMTTFFFKCPIGKQIWLLLNKSFISVEHVHLHYEIWLRPTSAEGKRERERERKWFEIFETKKRKKKSRRTANVTSALSSNIISLSLLSTLPSCHKESVSI